MWPTWSITAWRRASSTSSCGLGQVGGQWLLDQDGDAAAQEIRGHRMMLNGRHDNHGGIDQGQQRSVVAEGSSAAALGDGFGLGRVHVGHADQLYPR